MENKNTIEMILKDGLPVFGYLKNGNAFTIADISKDPLLWEDAKGLTPIGATVFTACRLYAPELWQPQKEALKC